MPSFSRPLSVQSPMLRGTDVLAAQRALRSLGFDVQPDGVFGPGTARAVQAFRQKRGLGGGEDLDNQTWDGLFAEPVATATADFPGVMKQLGTPHQYRDSVTWYLGPEGIAVSTMEAVGTPGEPLTVRRIMKDYGAAITESCLKHGLPVELVIATIATESSGNPNARREEPGYVSDSVTPDKVSVGLMQTLISTARHTMNDSTIDDPWLRIPANSIAAGVAYIAWKIGETGYDPPKVACAYNAGGLYYDPSPGNRWRMRQYPIGTSAHADRFVAYFNDTIFSLRTDPTQIGGPSFVSRLATAVAEAKSDPQIERLDLQPTARRAAYALKLKHPQVIFTSGRRSKADQARAMSQNVVLQRDWIEKTYSVNKVSLACQAWVDAHPEATSASAIEAGLMSVFNSMDDSELGRFSLHMSGNAFDLQPMEPDIAGIKATIPTLPGYRKFLEKEGNLVRWHAEFHA